MENGVKLRTSRKHPLVYSLIVAVVFTLSLNAAGVLIGLFGPDFLVNNGDFVFQGAAECFSAVVAILCIWLFGYMGIWNERSMKVTRAIGCSAYFIVVSLLSLVSIVPILLSPEDMPALQPVWKIIAFVITIFLIGFTEEVFFRGIVANLFYDKHAYDPAGVWTAVIGSGFIFGSMHLINLLSSNPVGVLVQVLSASVMGMALTAIYYRCRNIWVLIFIHSFVNLCGSYSAGIFDYGSSMTSIISSYGTEMIISAVPYLIVTIVLLRPSKMREIIAYRAGIDASQLPAVLPSSKRSKKGSVIAIVVALLLSVVMYGVAVYFEIASRVVYYNEYKEWNGEAEFSEEIAEFEVGEDGVYLMEVSCIPTNADTSVTFYIYDSALYGEGETYYLTVSGYQTVNSSVELKAGKSYRITALYNYSRVGGGNAGYLTTVEVTRM